MTVTPTPQGPVPTFSELPFPPRDRLRTTNRMLAGLLAAVVLLVAAVAALAVVIRVRTEPTPVPTGPSRSVTVDVSAQSASGAASLSDASGVSTEQLGGLSSDRMRWSRDVAFGEGIQVELTVTSINDIDFEDTDDATPGSLSCLISDEGGTRSEGRVSVQGASAVCRWVNDKQ